MERDDVQIGCPITVVAAIASVLLIIANSQQSADIFPTVVPGSEVLHSFHAMTDTTARYMPTGEWVLTTNVFLTKAVRCPFPRRRQNYHR